MAIPIALAITGAVSLINAVKDAVAAGKTDITEEQLDAALSELDKGDEDLSAAIARARAREAGGGG